MMSNKCLKYILIGVALLWAAVAKAQFLPNADTGVFPNKEIKPVGSVQNSNVEVRAPVSAAQVAAEERRLRKNMTSPFDYSKIDVKKKDAPKEDAVTITSKDGKKLDREAILIFMKNFNVYRTASGQVRCSVRFGLVSTYKDDISNVSYELKWPKMSTRLSFPDIEPQIGYYIDYLLLGDGCYTMDKVPNVIVNRCRVKNRTQESCAASVSWIKFGM